LIIQKFGKMMEEKIKIPENRSIPVFMILPYHDFT